MDQPHNTKAALTVSLMIGCCYGLLQSITAGIIEESPWNLQTDVLKGLMSSSVLIGAAVACIVAGAVSDALGPKKVLIGAACLAVICSIVLAVQTHIALFITFRVICGLTLGTMSTVAPAYMGELSSPKHRGSVVSLYQLAITVGIMLDYVLNYAFYRVSNGWKWEFGLCGIIPFIFIIASFFIPESYDWKENKKKQKEAKASKKNEEAEDSLSSSSSNQKSKEPKPSLPKRFCNSLKEVWDALISSKRAFIVGVVLAILLQLTGINAILMYCPTILERVGVVERGAKLLASIGVGGWNFLTTIFAVFLVDRLGRRPLLTAGFSLMSIGHVLAFVSTFIDASSSLAASVAVALVGIALFVLGFEVGPGPIFHVLMSELYPAEVRGRAISVLFTINWLANIAIVFVYLPLASAITERYTFLIFMILSVIAVVFIIFVVPETKGLTLEEIQRRGRSGDSKKKAKVGVEMEEAGGNTASGFSAESAYGEPKEKNERDSDEENAEGECESVEQMQPQIDESVGESKQDESSDEGKRMLNEGERLGSEAEQSKQE
ncbi:putative Sugar Porter (SP) Family MFS Transporter [Monocercomonoides exilis]|uniref:putative Sugar Porter (SP) Family MFS Transporter n=1 Tax=Monocercomonoides exilis TaxID=2049356 RepID=UPI00355AC103|nr:putative Sugar Porter (SP) Family MFS Transporter [Monocercomonoides exilis]|eukprot:MONOS_1371.1-p1 / transcript=MONOS_1371.1 / gene=MONOS_1371 / organism=Monocercomonoides_exilis_PA203 / gene_product=Sugar Porter (SP) Family MFS Transporter / transcript_product=Sugar Porter (SP) Family MFS Transporter / location=Mono_scaffold00023:209453-211550(-) / protein_length=550 / sequence_SO=supercontig / SO=protein_coding / is_pseudo=false